MAAQARVTQAAVEVLRQGPAAARATQVAVEVLYSLAAAPTGSDEERAAVAAHRNADVVRRPRAAVAY